MKRSSKAREKDASFEAARRDLHIRQGSAASIIEKTLGAFAQSDPRLWDRRAYLLLVGMVYERLVVDAEELSTDELIKLARALAENRRVEARSQTADQNSRDAASGDTDTAGNGSHARFADLVRKVYGLNFDGATDENQA